MLRLHTLGSTFVAGPDGVPITGAAAQRRLLALLAILGVAGDGGSSRDKLLALLWPDGEPERARHALTQTLYHARRALGCQELFGRTGADVALDPSCIACDVQEFERAADLGELEAAAALYRGPFLDGFFLSGSAEFEQWVTTQRSRLAARAAAIVERLADRDESRGDHVGALEWRRRLVTMDPLNGASSLKLMRTMAAAGDRAGALQHARVHEVLMREHLDAPPEPAVVALANRLRGELADQPAAAAHAWAPAARAASPLAIATTLEPDDTRTEAPGEEPSSTRAQPVSNPAGNEATPPPAAPRAGSGRRMLARVVAGIVLLGAAIGTYAIATGRREPAVVAGAAVPLEVVVAPFRVSGADASLAFLRDGMVELLSVRLGDDRLARSVDPGAVLGAWRAAGLAGVSDVPRAEAVRIASQLGAERVVTGSIVGGPARIVASASLVGVASGVVEAEATVEGPADSLTVLVDRLAARLIAANAGEGERLARHPTPTVAALRAYLEGQAAYRRGAYGVAMEHHERALELDSTFALAALQLALAADRLNDAEQHDRALALAWAARDALGARDRAHLVAFAGTRYPAPTPEAEQLAAWERAAALAPDRADVWLELGERFFHTGAVLGHDRALDRAAAAFRRALAIDPSSAPARRLLLLVAARTADSVTLGRLAAPTALRDSLGALAPSVQWRVALVRRDEAELRRLRAQFPRLDEPNLRAIAMSAMFDGVGGEDAERALRIRRARAVRASEQLDAILAQHALALMAARPVLALDLTEQLEEVQPGSRAHLRLRALDALHGAGDRQAAAEAIRVLSQSAAAPPAAAPAQRAVQLADLCVVEQWRLARGETGGTRAAIARLREAGTLPELVPVATPPLACAELLSAALAVAGRQTDALQQVQRLDSLMLAGPAMSDAGTWAHLLVAGLYRRLGEDGRALATLRRRSYLTGWPRYLASTRLEEARLAARLGEPEAAIALYRRYLTIASSPEPALAPAVSAVRAELARLEGTR